MDLQAEIAKVKELLAKAQDILVVTHEQPSPDSTGSMLALLLGLVSLGKKVTVACPDPMTVALSSFVGVNKVVSQLARKNFVISLDYVDGSIEKVSYNIEGNKFNLVIEPRSGFDTFSQDKVHYSYAGVTAQAIFTVDTIHLGGLKKLYEEDKELFAGKPIVNVDRHPNNAQFGQINVVDPVASSTAEVMARLLSALGIKLTQDIATNLLNAVFGATNNFTVPNITASAFDVASVCIKAGGKRFSDVQEPKVQEEAPVLETLAPIQERIAHPEAVPPQIPRGESRSGVQEVAPQTPADWLRPKIFKSSNLL